MKGVVGLVSKLPGVIGNLGLLGCGDAKGASSSPVGDVVQSLGACCLVLFIEGGRTSRWCDIHASGE